MADELFPIEAVASESPRLRWLKLHAVHTRVYPDEQVGTTCAETGVEIRAWAAWQERLSDELPSTANSAFGETEDDAICALAKARGWRLWNECEVSP